ncbi:hypothetical protein EDD21DRAFT_383044, partial [Dissophora ornata]
MPPFCCLIDSPLEVEAQSNSRVYEGSAVHRNQDQDDVGDEEEEMSQGTAPCTSENRWTYSTHREQELGNQDDNRAMQMSTNVQVQVEHQTQNQHRMLPISPLQMGSASGLTSRKRKAKQPKQPQPQVDSNNEATRQTTRLGINDEAAPPAVFRSDLDWARINNREEADAVFIAQQVRRANLHRNTLKSYDKYREHWSTWCTRHHYRDETVTNTRAARYFKESLGEPDPLNPDPNFQPLRRKKARTDALGDYYMPETIDFYIKAVVDLWNEQATSAPNG